MTPTASPDDVRVETDTILEQTEIQAVLERVDREIRRAYADTAVAFDDDEHRQDFEAVLAALRIAEGLDRRAEDISNGRTSETYETAEIDNLRNRVRRDDPGDEFGHSGGVIVRSDRHISTTEDHG